jgi:hypothetical protein
MLTAPPDPGWSCFLGVMVAASSFLGLREEEEEVARGLWEGEGAAGCASRRGVVVEVSIGGGMGIGLGSIGAVAFRIQQLNGTAGSA